MFLSVKRGTFLNAHCNHSEGLRHDPPKINVTPLIDVLLVLLIIFMVVAPLKPSSFQTKIPSKPATLPKGATDPDTVVVSVSRDLSLSVNERHDLGSETGARPAYLKAIFAQRAANGDLDENGNVIRSVFVKAPRNIGYGNVVKVIDAEKQAGAEPLALQIDYLDQ